MVKQRPETTGPISTLIRRCFERPALVLLVLAMALAYGGAALERVALDAVPDLSDTQVILHTPWPGRSPDLVEDQITYPLSAALLAAPRVRTVRGQSMLGDSFVYVVFEDGTDPYWARSRVLEYLSGLAARLPEGVRPRLGPDATGVGWAYQYALVDRSGRHDLAELRTLQDFTLRYWLEAVEGVAEVASVGGFQKEYQIHLDPNRLSAYGLSLPQVARAVRRSNNEAGGQVLELAEHEYAIRARGYVRGLEDLRRIAVGLGPAGTPVLLGDVAELSLGGMPRRGVGELDGEGEAVGGIVVMRQGADTYRVIQRVRRRIDEIRASLPEGVEIVPVYDRGELIARALGTLRHVLVEEMVVVSLVIALFLRHLPSILIACLTLPVAVLLAFGAMAEVGVGANIMSLGGIAVAIGAMVDAAIVTLENIHKRLAERADTGPPGPVIVAAMQEVGPSLFASLAIITVSFLPVFALTGASGRLFHPLAFTKTAAMAFAALLAVTLTPALARLVIRGGGDRGGGWQAALVRGYQRLVRWVVRRRRGVAVAAVLALLASLPLLGKLEREFAPPLGEGSILYMPTALPGMAVGEAAQVLQMLDRQLRSVPEVERVFGKIGRADTATDPAPLSMAEIVVSLKPREAWREGLDWDGLIAELDRGLKLPGLPNIWWMPIQTRLEMLNTGVRSALAVKLYGSDPVTLDALAIRVEQALAGDPRTQGHTRSAFAERVGGGFYLDVEIDRAAISRYGLSIEDVQETLSAAVGGLTLTHTVEGRARHPVTLRYARDYREDRGDLERVLVATPAGAQVPLGQLAVLRHAMGPNMLRSEDGQLATQVAVDLAGIGAPDYVALAQQVLAERVPLPAGYRLDFVGQYRYYAEARARLAWLVPLTLALVLALLLFSGHRLDEALFVLLSVPFSLIGALWYLWLLGFKLSIASGVGLIALAGLDAEMGILMLLYLRLAHRRFQAEGRLHGFADLTEAIVEGAATRLRPKLMTGLTLLAGLLPVMWREGSGADVMQRIAAPMIGGVVSLLVMMLVVYPALYALWHERAHRG